MSEIERNNALRRYVDLKDEYAEADRKAKAIKKERDEQMRLVHEMLRKGNTKGSTTVDLGKGYGTVRFTPGETVLADIYDEAALHAWIAENGRDDELYFPDKLRKKPLNEMVREIREHENAEFPPGLSSVESRKVTVTRVKT